MNDKNIRIKLWNDLFTFKLTVKFDLLVLNILRWKTGSYCVAANWPSNARQKKLTVICCCLLNCKIDHFTLKFTVNYS